MKKLTNLFKKAQKDVKIEKYYIAKALTEDGSPFTVKTRADNQEIAEEHLRNSIHHTCTIISISEIVEG